MLFIVEFLWGSYLLVSVMSCMIFSGSIVCVCVEGGVGGWSCQYFLRCNFLAEWPRGSLLWKSLWASGVDPLFGCSRVLRLKTGGGGELIPRLPHFQSLLPDSTLRTASTDTAQFSSSCFSFLISLTALHSMHLKVTHVFHVPRTHTLPLRFFNLHQ